MGRGNALYKCLSFYTIHAVSSFSTLQDQQVKKDFGQNIDLETKSISNLEVKNLGKMLEVRILEFPNLWIFSFLSSLLLNYCSIHLGYLFVYPLLFTFSFLFPIWRVKIKRYKKLSGILLLLREWVLNAQSIKSTLLVSKRLLPWTYNDSTIHGNLPMNTRLLAKKITKAYQNQRKKDKKIIIKEKGTSKYQQEWINMYHQIQKWNTKTLKECSSTFLS